MSSELRVCGVNIGFGVHDTIQGLLDKGVEATSVKLLTNAVNQPEWWSMSKESSLNRIANLDVQFVKG